MTSAELAAKTKTDERYLREWLSSQAAGGYVTYDDKTGKFSLSEEQAFTLANEDSPAYLPGAFELALGSLARFRGSRNRSAPARAWAGMNMETACSMDAKILSSRLCRQSCQLVDSALERCKAKLEAGARVADVGCGKGASTFLMAKAFPKSNSSDSTTTTNRLKQPANRLSATALPTASPLKWPRRKNFPAKTTTSWRSSIACMTWATRSERPRTSGSRWPRTGHG